MRNHLKVILFLLLSPAVSFCQNHSVKQKIVQVENNLMPYVPIKDFKGWNILDRMKVYNVPGVSIAVIKDYKVDWAKGYGMADTLKKIPVDVNTMFSAGSISKLVTAAGALGMVQSKQISLDTPINNYLSSWKIKENDFTKKTPITLRMLLSHTAGTSQSSYFGFTPDKKPLPSVIEILNGDPIADSKPVVVNFEPAKEFRYSGGGSVIAQLAMMDASGKSFAPLMQSLVFEKLSMKNSTFEQPLPHKYDKQAAWAYSSASWFKGMPYVYPQQAAAGLYTTPTDLAKLFIDIQKSLIGKGIVLQQETAKLMMSPQAKVSEGTYREEIGIGPFLIQRADNSENKGIYFEFTGVNAGFLAYGIAGIEGGNGVIVMLNSGDDSNGLGKEIRRAVAKTYGWYKFLPDEIKPITLPDDQLEKYTGRYRKGIDEVIYLRRENNYLIENINTGPDIYCFPIAKDTIAFSDYNIKAVFNTDSNGIASSLKTEWQDKPMPKMKPDEFSPSEYLRDKNYGRAKEGFAAMKMNEYQITYLAYDLLTKIPLDALAVKAVLEVAVDQHPDVSIVYCRWGDYYLSQSNKAEAIRSYEKAQQLDPNDADTKSKLDNLR